MKTDDRQKIAAKALRAAIRFSAETISICDMNPELVSSLNRTATVRNLQRNINAMQRFVDLLNKDARD